MRNSAPFVPHGIAPMSRDFLESGSVPSTGWAGMTIPAPMAGLSAASRNDSGDCS